MAAHPSSPPVEPPRATLDKRKSIILAVVGLVFLVLIFWKVIPSIGSYADAWAAIQDMGWISAVVIVVALLLYLAVYGLTFPAAAPGLTYWQGQQVNQAAFAISNGVPGGGAVGLAVQYGMLTSHGITAAATTAAIAAVGLWSIFVTLGFPILGVLALSVSGEAGGAYLAIALIGLAVLAAAVLILVMVVRSEPLAKRLAEFGNKLLRPFARRIKKLQTVDLVPSLLNFRNSIYSVVTKRSIRLTLAQSGIFFTQFLILYVALRGIEGWDSAGTAFLIAFGAFAISQLGLMIPITPGGVGTVDAFMISILVASGTDNATAVAAALVWRAASFVPQIIVGVLALVSWYRTAGKAFATTQPTTPEG
jgi:uncharacterized protein (TIRG00374 family)